MANDPQFPLLSERAEDDSGSGQIVRAERGDLEVVQKLLFDVIDELEIYNDDAKRIERNLYSIDHLCSLLSENGGAVLLEQLNGTKRGFLIARHDNGPIWLSWFGVAKQWRGHGIGDRLIERLIGLAATTGIHKIWCDTRVNNDSSIRVLLGHGFQRMCRLDNHWCNQDYYIWQRFIRADEGVPALHER